MPGSLPLAAEASLSMRRRLSRELSAQPARRCEPRISRDGPLVGRGRRMAEARRCSTRAHRRISRPHCLLSVERGRLVP